MIADYFESATARLGVVMLKFLSECLKALTFQAHFLKISAKIFVGAALRRRNAQNFCQNV